MSRVAAIGSCRVTAPAMAIRRAGVAVTRTGRRVYTINEILALIREASASSKKWVAADRFIVEISSLRKEMKNYKRYGKREFVAGVKEISRALKSPVLFVPNIYVVDPETNTGAENRRTIGEWIPSGLLKKDSFFNPSSIIRWEHMKDRYHYNEEGDRIVSAALAKLL